MGEPQGLGGELVEDQVIRVCGPRSTCGTDVGKRLTDLRVLASSDDTGRDVNAAGSDQEGAAEPKPAA